MLVGILTIDLFIPYRESIKEKRNVLRSLKDMIRKKFNVSVSEIPDDLGELNGRTKLAIAAVSGETGHLQSVLGNVYNLVESFHGDKIIFYKTEILHYE